MGQYSAFESSRLALKRLVLPLAAATVLAGCAAGGGAMSSVSETQGFDSQSHRPLQQKAKVKVALLLPLSAKGNTANVAKGLKQAGELALFEFDNPNILLITKDTKGTPGGARAAAEAAVREGAELVIGPLFAKSVSTAAPVTRSANVPMIALSSDQSVAGKGVYLLSFLAGRDVPRIVSYAAGQGKQNFAALIPNTPYGRIVEKEFQKAVRKSGGKVAAVQRIPLDANGMLEPTRKIAALARDETNPLDAIMIPGGPETLASLAPLMPYFEVDTKKVKLIGTGRWDYDGVGREKAMIGGWFPAPDPKGWREFTKRYVKTYGNVPPRISSLAYDAVSLAVSLSSNPPKARYTPEQITRATGFAGIDGLFRINADGTTERGLAILEVQRFGGRVIEPAPSSFSQTQAQF